MKAFCDGIGATLPGMRASVRCLFRLHTPCGAPFGRAGSPTLLFELVWNHLLRAGATVLTLLLASALTLVFMVVVVFNGAHACTGQRSRPQGRHPHRRRGRKGTGGAGRGERDPRAV